MAEHEEHGDEHGEGGGGHGGGGHGHGGGHGGGSHEEHEGAPEWLISFADNVALLMGFFVILLAMNMKEPTTGGIGGKEGPNTPQPTKQWLDMVIAIRESFHSGINMNSNDPREAPLRQRKLEKEREAKGDSIIEGPEGDKRTAQAIKPSEWIAPTAKFPFEFGMSTLSETMKAEVKKAAREVVGKMNILVEVRGHVSASEVKADPVRARELSFQRAMTVAGLMVEAGVTWPHLRIVACGESAPAVARADSVEEHRSNQRVELVQIQEAPPPDQFSDGAKKEPK